MIDLTKVQTFQDQDILNILRLSLASSAVATQYGINGRSLTRSSPTEIQALIREYEDRIYRRQNGIFVATAARYPD